MPVINQPVRYIEWSPIIAGTILACAVSVVLMQFGHALGLSFSHLQTAKAVTSQSVFVLGLFVLWTQLSASLTGGYLAGRMLTPWDASHESELRDGAHGLLVWALSTLLVTVAVAAATFIAQFTDAHAVTDISPDLSKKITIISGFSLAAISVISAVAAWMIATFGGEHRDRKIDVLHHVSFRRRAV